MARAPIGSVAGYEITYGGQVPALVLINSPEFVRGEDRAQKICAHMREKYGAECEYRPLHRGAAPATEAPPRHGWPHGIDWTPG